LLSLFLAFGLAPQLIAWALPPTAVDFSVYVMCGIVLGVWSILAVTMKGIVHLGAAPARSS
jgi:hypothetical protein